MGETLSGLWNSQDTLNNLAILILLIKSQFDERFLKRNQLIT